MKKISVPDDHQIGTEVTEGGSKCANCAYVSADLKHCSMTMWVETPKKDGGGGGDSALPKPANKYCCDFWEKQSKTALRVTAKEVRRNG